MGYTISAVNGMSSWIETFAEVGFVIGAKLTEELNLGLVDKTYESQGRTGLYELTVKITNAFEELNRNRMWDGEFFDEVDEFIDRQLNPDNEPAPGAMTNQELFEALNELDLLSLDQIHSFSDSGGGVGWNERGAFIDMLRGVEEPARPTILIIIRNGEDNERQFYSESDFMNFVKSLYCENEEDESKFEFPDTIEKANRYFDTYCSDWRRV